MPSTRVPRTGPNRSGTVHEPIGTVHVNNEMLDQDERAELAAFRARAARNARRRERRQPGGDYVGQQVRQAAYGATYAAAGTVSLAELDKVADVHRRVLEAAVIRLVQDEGYSWSMVGAELGVTRQAAQQRFGHLVKSRRARGAQPAHLR